MPLSPQSIHMRRGRSLPGPAAEAGPAALAALPDDDLLEQVARRTFRYFWEGAHPQSGLAFDRCGARDASPDDPISIGGTGFGILAILVAAERGWIARAAALERLDRMVELLLRAPVYHGAFPHFLHGGSGATIPFWRKA